MKEAAGEANMTVITIILIGVVLAAGGFIINALMKTVEDKAKEESTGHSSDDYLEDHWR